MKIYERSKVQMQQVLNGEDINVSLPGECGKHYLEENWERLCESQRLLVRKWIRFMFSHAKNMNYKHSSYGLKHSCESCVGFYVHNDVIKKAFLLEGYYAQTGKINWFFNCSGEVTLKKINRFKEVFKEEILQYKDYYKEV